MHLGEAVITELDEMKPLLLQTWTCSDPTERSGHVSGNALMLATDGHIGSVGRQTWYQ